MREAISKIETINQCSTKQCNIEKVQHLIVRYYNGTMLNSATITMTITTSATTTSAI